MDQATAKKLCAINTRFYAENAASFSQTRNAPWDGWRRCLDACGMGGPDETISDQPTSDRSADRAAVSRLANPQLSVRSVLDIACGNLRFEAFLEREYPAIDWRICALDNCEPLVGSSEAAIAEKVSFICDDIVANLLDGLPIVKRANIPALEYNPANIPTLENIFAPENASEFAHPPTFDIVVSFGFMHHIPGFELRVRFLKEALSYVKPGGYLALSFWQFMNDEARREKAQCAHAEALEHLGLCPTDLEQGDYLLGWKNLPGQYRYCHHFSDEEIERFIAELSPSARMIASFCADGKTGNLNRYVILKRNLHSILG